VPQGFEVPVVLPCSPVPLDVMPSNKIASRHFLSLPLASIHVLKLGACSGMSCACFVLPSACPAWMALGLCGLGQDASRQLRDASRCPNNNGVPRFLGPCWAPADFALFLWIKRFILGTHGKTCGTLLEALLLLRKIDAIIMVSFDSCFDFVLWVLSGSMCNLHSPCIVMGRPWLPPRGRPPRLLKATRASLCAATVIRTSAPTFPQNRLLCFACASTPIPTTEIGKGTTNKTTNMVTAAATPLTTTTPKIPR